MVEGLNERVFIRGKGMLSYHCVSDLLLNGSAFKAVLIRDWDIKRSQRGIRKKKGK